MVTRVCRMLCALWLTLAHVVTGSLSLDLSSFVTPYTSSFSGVSTVVLSSSLLSQCSTNQPGLSFSVYSTNPSFVYSTPNPSFSFQSLSPPSFSFAPPPEPRVTLEVDMTIQNESVDTFSSLKQLNLRLAFAILLKIEAELIRIQSVTNVGVSAFLVSFATASGVDVLLGIELDPSMNVMQHMRAVETLFSDGSLVSYLEQLGTPMQLELNRVGVGGDGDDRNDDNEGEGSSTGSESGDERERTKKTSSPAAVIVGTTVGFAVFFFLVVCAAKQKRTKIPVLGRMFTRIVPDAPSMK